MIRDLASALFPRNVLLRQPLLEIETDAKKNTPLNALLGGNTAETETAVRKILPAPLAHPTILQTTGVSYQQPLSALRV